VATASTSYNEPFHIARKFASLDHLSSGRAAWNVVTSTSDAEAASFGRDRHFEHGARYQRAEEFVDVVRSLWDSWEDDAFLFDKASGRYLDSSKLHEVKHRGAHYAVQGTLNVPRAPQGHPVLVQAGSSEEGLRLAARIADVMFTTQQDLPEAQAFYTSIKNAVRAQGRNPDHYLVMPGLSVVVGNTREHAEEKLRELYALTDIDQAVAFLGAISGGVDLSGHDLDGPVPEFPPGNGNRSKQALFLRQARAKNLTVRQLALQVAGSGGHRVLAGTATEIADEIELWFKSGAADGFNFKPLYHTANLAEFSAQVIPILQERGLFHTDYAGRTLRENLGLPKPSLRHDSSRVLAQAQS
jgi:alkanesulfonate monooxygenase